MTHSDVMAGLRVEPERHDPSVLSWVLARNTSALSMAWSTGVSRLGGGAAGAVGVKRTAVKPRSVNSASKRVSGIGGSPGDSNSFRAGSVSDGPLPLSEPEALA